jgi:hypothetical protein
MKKRFYLGLIILAVLLLALGGLTVRATRATVRVLVHRGRGGQRLFGSSGSLAS